MTEGLLEVRALQVNYGRLVAVREVSIAVAEGEIVCIVGPNGAGKSTTLLAVAGALRPLRGDIRFDGRSLLDLRTEDVVRRGISLVPEGRHIFSRLSVEENLRLATFVRRDRDAVESELEALMARFPFLKERLDQPAGRLSGGEQQQLAIARALLTSPRLLLVDEPSLGLAPLVVDHVYQSLMTLREAGLTLLVVEQSLERALQVADRVCVLRNGTVQLTGTHAELRESPELEEAYFGFTRAESRRRGADSEREPTWKTPSRS